MVKDRGGKANVNEEKSNNNNATRKIVREREKKEGKIGSNNRSSIILDPDLAALLGQRPIREAE